MKPYYEQGGITIYHADALEVIAELSEIDLVFIDPPFYLPARISTSRRHWPRMLANVGIMEGYFREAFTALREKLKPTGAFYTFSDSTSYAVFLSLAYPLYDRTQCIVWDKVRGGMGRGWRHAHELIVHGALKDTVYSDGFRQDVLHCPVVPSREREHPSEKPIMLLEQILQAHPPGVVLDCFMGTGTVLQAAKNLDWQAIGCDIDERNCEIAAVRLSTIPSDERAGDKDIDG